ncbi:MAG: hypothetical protein V2A79_18850 [Planctomycetota bacterium]
MSAVCLSFLAALICAGCGTGGVWDIVLGSLRLAGGIVDVATQ